MKYVALGMAILALSLVSDTAFGTDPINAGHLKNVTWRHGWITFYIIGADGTNYCEPCPVDSSATNYNRCWISDTKSAQVSMLLLADAQDRLLSGRVIDITTDCTVYQMTVHE